MDNKPEDYGPVPFKGWNDVRTLLRNVRQLGAAETAKRAKMAALLRWEFWAGRRFDRRFNVDTTELAEVSDLTTVDAGAKTGGDYMATSITVLRGALAKLPHDIGPFAFVDYGSGKGRTLLLASDYGFKKIIGVEYTKELHRIACNNIERYQNDHQQCFMLQSVCADAVTFPLPEEPCVFYYYNCFELELFARIFRNVEQSYRAHPRKMYFIFYHLKPPCAAWFETLGIARKAKLHGFSWRLVLPRPYALSLYETI